MFLFTLSTGASPDRSVKGPIQTPNARMDMKHYTVAEIVITDHGWVAEYVANVTPLVEAHGGRYLARTARIERIEGERTPPQLFLLIEWPSKADAMAFYDSDEYRPYREARRAGATGEFVLVAAEDVSGVAHVP